MIMAITKDRENRPQMYQLSYASGLWAKKLIPVLKLGKKDIGL
jgi:hypothetical protein